MSKDQTTTKGAAVTDEVAVEAKGTLEIPDGSGSDQNIRLLRKFKKIDIDGFFSLCLDGGSYSTSGSGLGGSNYLYGSIYAETYDSIDRRDVIHKLIFPVTGWNGYGAVIPSSLLMPVRKGCALEISYKMQGNWKGLKLEYHLASTGRGGSGQF